MKHRRINLSFLITIFILGIISFILATNKAIAYIKSITTTKGVFACDDKGFNLSFSFPYQQNVKFTVYKGISTGKDEPVETIFTRSGQNLIFKDYDVQPNTRYAYSVVGSNGKDLTIKSNYIYPDTSKLSVSKYPCLATPGNKPVRIQPAPEPTSEADAVSPAQPAAPASFDPTSKINGVFRPSLEEKCGEDNRCSEKVKTECLSDEKIKALYSEAENDYNSLKAAVWECINSQPNPSDTNLGPVNNIKLSTACEGPKPYINISWSKVSNAKQYQVFRCTGESSCKPVSQTLLNADTTSLKDADIVYGRNLTYKIAAINPYDESTNKKDIIYFLDDFPCLKEDQAAESTVNADLSKQPSTLELFLNGSTNDYQIFAPAQEVNVGATLFAKLENGAIDPPNGCPNDIRGYLLFQFDDKITPETKKSPCENYKWKVTDQANNYKVKVIYKRNDTDRLGPAEEKVLNYSVSKTGKIDTTIITTIDGEFDPYDKTIYADSPIEPRLNIGAKVFATNDQEERCLEDVIDLQLFKKDPGKKKFKVPLEFINNKIRESGKNEESSKESNIDKYPQNCMPYNIALTQEGTYELIASYNPAPSEPYSGSSSSVVFVLKRTPPVKTYTRITISTKSAQTAKRTTFLSSKLKKIGLSKLFSKNVAGISAIEENGQTKLVNDPNADTNTVFLTSCTTPEQTIPGAEPITEATLNIIKVKTSGEHEDLSKTIPNCVETEVDLGGDIEDADYFLINSNFTPENGSPYKESSGSINVDVEGQESSDNEPVKVVSLTVSPLDPNFMRIDAFSTGRVDTPVFTVKNGENSEEKEATIETEDCTNNCHYTLDLYGLSGSYDVSFCAEEGLCDNTSFSLDEEVVEATGGNDNEPTIETGIGILLPGTEDEIAVSDEGFDLDLPEDVTVVKLIVHYNNKPDEEETITINYRSPQPAEQPAPDADGGGSEPAPEETPAEEFVQPEAATCQKETFNLNDSNQCIRRFPTTSAEKGCGYEEEETEFTKCEVGE